MSYHFLHIRILLEFFPQILMYLPFLQKVQPNQFFYPGRVPVKFHGFPFCNCWCPFILKLTLKPTFSYLDFGFKVERFNSYPTFNFVYISSPRESSHNSVVDGMKTQVQQGRNNKHQGKALVNKLYLPVVDIMTHTFNLFILWRGFSYSGQCTALPPFEKSKLSSIT